MKVVWRFIWKQYIRIREVMRTREIERKKEYYQKKNLFIPIENFLASGNDRSQYWTEHMVHEGYFVSARESLKYRKQIFKQYPQYCEFADMKRKHKGETILDYGCGPGNDLVWYTQKTNLKSIVGMDVSSSALKMSQYRMSLHRVKSDKCRLILLDEKDASIPLGDETIDFVSCQGVLMHTTFPDRILSEFYRVLRHSSAINNACVMVYNKESIWYHLYAAYYLRFIDSSELGIANEEAERLSVEEIFRMSTDGSKCPMARCYSSEVFKEMCYAAGFDRVDYYGGYANALEIMMAKEYINRAIEDPRLEEMHKDFLRKVSFDGNGYPCIEKDNRFETCCIAGVYRLYKY